MYCMIRGKIAKGGAAGEMPRNTRHSDAPRLFTRAKPSRTYCYSWPLDPARDAARSADREWPIPRHRLLKMGGQLGRDEWLRLVNRLLIDVKFRSIDRGSSKLQTRFSPFFFVATRHIGNALISSFFKISASNKNQNEEKTLQFHTQLITHIFYF